MKKFRKILLIDDDETTCYVNKMLLKSMAIANHIEIITDSARAFKYILDNYHKKTISASEGADLIFLDISMPGMDGFEMLDDMESLNVDRSRIFIIMLTTSISTEDRKRAATYGDKLQGYLIKPLKKEKVEEIVNLFLH